MSPLFLCTAFLSLLISVSGSDIDYFNYFIKKYGKNYKVGTSEYSRRFRAFQVMSIQYQHQHRESQLSDTPSFWLQHTLTRIRVIDRRNNSNDAFYGITEFADMTPDEFNQFLLRSGSALPSDTSERVKRLYASADLLSRRDVEPVLPLRVDWREKGIISHVRNQGKCGACWAYSTVETIESMNALALKTTVWPLSVQQVIDCASSSSSPNRGCDGGDTCAALSWMLKSEVKLVSEDEYPMRDESGQCRESPSRAGVQVANFTCEE